MATPVVLVAALMVGVVTAVSLAAAAAITARHRATAVADVVALTVAWHALDGTPAACRAGAAAAAADGAGLDHCDLVDGVATVTVHVPAPGWWGTPRSVRARARAGRIPADPGD